MVGFCGNVIVYSHRQNLRHDGVAGLKTLIPSLIVHNKQNQVLEHDLFIFIYSEVLRYSLQDVAGTKG